MLQLCAQDEYEAPSNKNESSEPLYKSKDSIVIENVEDKSRSKASNNNSERSEFRKNFRIGGGFGLTSYFDNRPQINSQLLVFGLAPQFTYVMNDYFEAGISTSYQYIGSFGKVNSHSYSVGPVIRAYPFDMIFLQMEGMFFRNTTSIDFGGFTSKVSENNINVFAGGGLIQRFGPRSYALTGLQVNMIKNSYTNNQIIPSIITSIHFGI